MVTVTVWCPNDFTKPMNDLNKSASMVAATPRQLVTKTWKLRSKQPTRHRIAFDELFNADQEDCMPQGYFKRLFLKVDLISSHAVAESPCSGHISVVNERRCILSCKSFDLSQDTRKRQVVGRPRLHQRRRRIGVKDGAIRLEWALSVGDARTR